MKTHNNNSATVGLLLGITAGTFMGAGLVTCATGDIVLGGGYLTIGALIALSAVWAVRTLRELERSDFEGRFLKVDDTPESRERTKLVMGKLEALPSVTSAIIGTVLGVIAGGFIGAGTVTCSAGDAISGGGYLAAGAMIALSAVWVERTLRALERPDFEERFLQVDQTAAVDANKQLPAPQVAQNQSEARGCIN